MIIHLFFLNQNKFKFKKYICPIFNIKNIYKLDKLKDYMKVKNKIYIIIRIINNYINNYQEQLVILFSLKKQNDYFLYSIKNIIKCIIIQKKKIIFTFYYNNNYKHYRKKKINICRYNNYNFTHLNIIKFYKISLINKILVYI